MKRLLLSALIVLITGCFVYAVSDHPAIKNQNDIRYQGRDGESLSRQSPDYSFPIDPINIILSYYDYFPGGFDSIPIRVQPSPAGFQPGGGIYLTFLERYTFDVQDRVFYTYIEDFMITAGPSLVDVCATICFPPAIDLDPDTGVPFVAWLGGSNDILATLFTYDQYDLIGMPGLWNNPYPVSDTPEHPAVFVGPSPITGQRRIYVFGKDNSTNTYHQLAYADFSEPADLANPDIADWTYINLPNLPDWYDFGMVSFCAPIVSKETGHIAIVGHTEDINSDDPFNPHNFIFVLENNNYGEGDWTTFTGNPTIPVINPDDYFVDHNSQPFQDMRYRAYINRHNSVIDEHGNYHFAAIFALFAENNFWFPRMTTVKHIKYDRALDEFIITDLYPRNEDGSLYLPWSIPPEYDDGGYLIVNQSWPCYWYPQPEDLIFENYHRMIADENRMVVLFQSSTEDFIPDTHIMISVDHGTTWSDPILLNSLNDPELVNMSPAYWYIADHMENLGNDWWRIHVMFYDQNDYGSHYIGNGPNTGGHIMYTPIDIHFGSLSAEQEFLVNIPGRILKQNYPNPFNPETTISFRLPEPQNIRLDIYNILGQRLNTLIVGHRDAGIHSVIWDGRDANDKEVASGVYFYRLRSENFSETRRMLLIR